MGREVGEPTKELNQPNDNGRTGSAVASRPSTVLHLAQKLNYLLAHAHVDKLTFLNALSHSTVSATGEADQRSAPAGTRNKKNKDVITKRTIQGWLNDVRPERRLHLDAQKKIIAFFEAQIPGFTFSSDLFQSEFNAFCVAVTARPESVANEITLILARSPDMLEDVIVKYLVGKYVMYRYSFADLDDVISEIAIISKSNQPSRSLTIDVYCPPADTQRQVHKLEDAEHFSGNIFQFGKMFYATVSFAKAESSRIRYYHFPRLDAVRWIHYGISTGYSANLREPVAAKVLARKLRKDTLEEGDANFISRHEPASAALSKFRHLIDNPFERRDALILKVDQAKVVPLIGKLN